MSDKNKGNKFDYKVNNRQAMTDCFANLVKKGYNPKYREYKFTIRKRGDTYVTSSARLLFKIVASIYNPFSVKTLVAVLFFVETFVDENFDRKSVNSSSVNLNM